MGKEWSRLYKEIAEPQQGVVAVRQVLACGIPIATFHRHAHRHGWERLWHGVWAVPGNPDTYERRCWGALLAVPGSVLTGESALGLAGILRIPPVRVALLVPPSLHPAARQGLRIHRGRWVRGDRVEGASGLRSAPLLRALTDFAADHSANQVEQAIAALDRLRCARPRAVRTYVHRRGRFPGRRKLVRALDQMEGELTHSTEESYARALLRDADLPWQPHPRPMLIEVDGTYQAEIDLAWPRVRYGVEVDGPHHLLPDVAAADRERDRRLARLRWTVDRFFTDEIRRDPAGFVDQVRRGLTAAANRDVPPWEVKREG